MLHSSAKPSPIPASDDNHEKGFVTRSEMKLIFDDDKVSVTIETPAGKKITLDEDSGDILIEDENSNVITMNADGISLESGADVSIVATGDVNIEGTNVNIAANAEFVAEGCSRSRNFNKCNCSYQRFISTNKLIMGQPAARITDMHVCPMVTGTVPHVGGPILPPGEPTVLIGGMPAAVLGDMATCTGPPDSIIAGSSLRFNWRENQLQEWETLPRTADQLCSEK